MAKAALVIMAAGLGSRYGGVKQISGVGPHGEILMEYAIYDAVRAGFDQVVFIVTSQILGEIREKFEAPLRSMGVETSYAIQDYTSLPEWYEVPKDRIKPYGTAHAIYCIRGLVHCPFAVINADDYYGSEGFSAIYEALLGLKRDEAVMVGYKLANTVSRYGSVTRGVCTEENGLLRSVTETYDITVFPDGSIRDTHDTPEGKVLDPDAVVSMNFWGFRPEFLEDIQEYLFRFLRGLTETEIKAECLLPALVDEKIRIGALAVTMLRTGARWFGMTYQQDHPIVQSEIRALHESGVYPETLPTTL